MTATLRETAEGNLDVYVETPDLVLSGRSVRVEVIGRGEPLRPDPDLVLGPWKGGCDAKRTFGPLRELAPRLGEGCVLLASLLEKSPHERDG